MGKITGLLRAFISWVTMKNARHNRSLRDILYLAKTIENFFVRYRLREEGSNFNTLFGNRGTARIDATEIAYHTGIRIRRVRNIEGKDLPLQVEDVYNALDELKRLLFTPTLSSKVLAQCVSKLEMAFENLLSVISGIGYK